MKVDHLVIDFETLAIGPRARILEFGAVGMSGPEFHHLFSSSMAVNPFDGDQADRDLCPDTWIWWGKRMAAGHEIPGIDSERSLGEVVAQFLTLWDAFCGRETQLWCWGLDFDVPILADILRAYGHKVPWHHQRMGCIRTLCRELRIAWPEGHESAHRALPDAIGEAKMLERALRYITSGRKGAVS